LGPAFAFEIPEDWLSNLSICC